MSNPISLFCLIHGQPFARAFPVKINKDDTVGDLKKLIVKEKPNDFKGIDADHLDLWKVEIPVTDDDETPQKPELRERKLGPTDEIGEVFPKQPLKKHVHIIIRGPSPANVVADEDHQEPELTLIDSHSNPLRDLVTFEYSGDINASDVNWEQAVTENRFGQLAELPQFIKDIVGKPRPVPDDESKVLLSPIVECLFELLNRDDITNNSLINEFKRTFGNLFCETGTAPPYVAWHLELAHFAFAVAHSVSLAKSTNPESSLEPGTRREETHRRSVKNAAHRLVLDWFEAFWMTVVGSPLCTYGKSLPFPIVVHVTQQNELRKYTPQPDATFLEHNTPRFLVEIDSHGNGKDEHRLNIYATCVLRLLARLKGEHDVSQENNQKVFLMTAYFAEKPRTINRTFLFMNNDNQVCRNQETFNINDASQLTRFLREFYGYALQFKKGVTNDGEQRADIKKIGKIIIGSIKKSLYTKDLFNDSGTPGNGLGGIATRSSRQGGSRSQQQGTDAHDAMIDALKGSDYKLEDYSHGFLPLFDLPDHIAEAKDSKQNRLIVKLVRNKRSNELALLKELCERQSRLNHVVPLVDTFMSNLGPLLILEQGSSLSAIGSNSIDKDEASRLSRELIEGVAFLHGQNIAHMDIKPDNLVRSFKTKKLLIIDFDMAIECNSAEELVDNRCCGTPGWCAPEIDLSGKKRQQAFSPIRADLWSCGMVLGHIARMGGYSGFGQLIKMLMVVDPRRRCLLHQVVDEKSVDWTTDQLVEAFGWRARNEEIEETMLGGNKLKRSRDDVSSGDSEGLALKMVKRSAVWTDYSGGSETSASSGFSELPSPASEILGYAKGEHIGHAGEISEKDGMYSDASMEEMSVFSSNA